MNKSAGIMLTENKHLEIQLIVKDILCSEWFVFNLETRSNCDHKGITFRFELLKKLYLGIQFYDIRHKDE